MNRYFFAIIATLLAGVMVAALCGEDEGLNGDRTIDVGDLTLAEVQERARAAIERESHVYHVVIRDPNQQGEEAAYDAWIDAGRDLSRVQFRVGESIRVSDGGRIGHLMEERFYEGPCEPCPPDVAVREAPHLNWILGTDTRDVSIDGGSVEGEPTIRVRLTREYGGDYTGDAVATIDLDESFLPVRMRVDPPGPLPDQEMRFESEFVTLDALAPDFFSFDAIRAMAGGPIADIEAAAAAGLDTYWLGGSFETMILRDESRFYPQGQDPDGGPALTLSYGPANPMSPAPCARIGVRQAGGRTPVPDAMTPFDTVTVGGETATLYHADRPEITVPPPHPDDRASEADATLPPGVVPAETAAPLTPVPQDEGDMYAAVIETDDTIIDVTTNCGPAGSNIYRTENAFRRLVSSLRLYEEAR